MLKQFQLTLFFFLYLIVFQTVQSKDLNYFVELKEFNAENGKYFDLYLSLDASSIYFQKENSEFNCKILTEIFVSRNDTFFFADKFNLHSPNIKDTSLTSRQFFLNETKRISLKEGTFQLEVKFTDLNSPKKQVHSVIRKFEVKMNNNEIGFSDLLFISSLKKSNENCKNCKYGYEITPFITNSNFIDQDSLQFWMEVYNAEKSIKEPYYFETYLINANTNQRIEKTVQITKPKTPKSFDVYVGRLKIKDLTSQNYLLCIVLKANDGKELAKKITKIYNIKTKEFTSDGSEEVVYNQYFGYDDSTLKKHILTLYHISTPTEINFLSKLETYSERKNFFVNFWRKRITNNDMLNKEWYSYLARVNYSNKNFKSAMREGWMTDRGRIMCIYGPPNDLQSFPHEADKFPYQTWFYNNLGVQNGVIFVFYDPDLATNEWPLIHSTKYGEYNNRFWRQDVIRGKMGSMSGYDPENNDIRDQFRDQNLIMDR